MSTVSSYIWVWWLLFSQKPHPAVGIYTLSKVIHSCTFTGSAGGLLKARANAKEDWSGFTHSVIHALWGHCCWLLFGLCLLLILIRKNGHTHLTSACQLMNQCSSSLYSRYCNYKLKHFTSWEGICRLYNLNLYLIRSSCGFVKDMPITL